MSSRKRIVRVQSPRGRDTLRMSQSRKSKTESSKHAEAFPKENSIPSSQVFNDAERVEVCLQMCPIRRTTDFSRSSHPISTEESAVEISIVVLVKDWLEKATH